LASDQVTAEDKEEIDADPAEAMGAARKREAHDAGVVDNYNDDRDGAEKIEARLALAVGKARVNLSSRFVNSVSLAANRRK
jgi:hypothetical protein